VGTQRKAPEAKAPEAPFVERRKAPATNAEMAYTGTERRNAVKDTAGVNETIARDQNMPKSPAEEAKARAAALTEANPEPTRAETKGTHDENGVRKNPSNVRKPGEELSTEAQTVQHKALESISSLSNDNLDKMARELGINPNDPIYSRAKEMRGEGREQTGRIRQANAILERMNSDEIVKAASKTAEINERPEAANWARAKRAEEVFKERLAGAQQAEGYGAKNTGVTKEAKDAALKSFNDKATRSNAGFDPSMLADAAKVAAYHVEAGARAFADFSAKMIEDFGEGIRPYLKDLHTKASEEGLKEETAKTSAKDTDHMQAAIKELRPDAKLSDITKRAQELKDTHAQVAAHNENGGSTFHPTKGNLDGKPFFSVGGEPEFRDPKLKMTTDGKNLTAEQLNEFSKRPEVKAALDKHKDASIGSWYDQETGKTTTELVKTPADRDEAIAMGKRNGEKAIWDLKNREEIKTGGTGEGPVEGKVSGDVPSANYHGEPLSYTHDEDLHHVITKDDTGAKIGELVAKDIAPGTIEVTSNQVYGKDLQGAGRGVDQVQHLLDNVDEDTHTVKSDISTTKEARGAWDKVMNANPDAVTKKVYKDGQTQYTVDMDKYRESSTGPGGEQSVGAAKAGTAMAKGNPLTPKQLQERLPDVAKNNLTEQEKEGLTTTKAGKPRDTSKFVNTLMDKIPTIQEYVDIAKLGEGARKWYQRSKQAFDGLVAAAPDYFGKEGDQDRFIGMLAGSSPRQSVAMNLRETLAGWKNWVDAGRPELSVDKWKQFVKEARDGYMDAGKPEGMSAKQFRAAFTDARKMLREAKGEEPDSPVFDTEGLDEETSADKDFWDYKPDNVSQENWDHMKDNLRGKTVWDYRPSGDEWKHEKMMSESFTPATSKVPNIIKALRGEDLWPDLSKNAAFKVPSFVQNLRGWLNYVTNDGWMALFGDLKATDITSPDSYHPLAVATREAAKILGWEPAEAQAAIWSFCQALTERGERDPNVIREQSEDFADLLATDPETQKLLGDLGVNREQLSKHLRENVEAKPAVTTGTAPTTAHSVRQLEERIRAARGKKAIPPPKSAQGSLFNDSNFREDPATEQRANPGSGHLREETAEESRLTKLGKKKSPYGSIR
jgi:hypothetical protein